MSEALYNLRDWLLACHRGNITDTVEHNALNIMPPGQNAPPPTNCPHDENPLKSWQCCADR